MKLRLGPNAAKFATDTPSVIKFVTVDEGGSTSIGSVTVSGSVAPTVDLPATYTVSVNGGTATNLSYGWTVAGATINSGQGTTSISVTFTSSGPFDVDCDVSDPDARNSPVTGTLAVVAGTQTGGVDIGSTFDPLVDTWESFADLQAAISATSSGGTADLSGRGFRSATFGSTDSIDVPRDMTISGAYVCGGYSPTWVEHETIAGLFYADAAGLDDLYVEVRNHLIDHAAAAAPSLHQFPSLPDGYENNSHGQHYDWFILRDEAGSQNYEGEVIDNGDVITSAGNNESGQNVLGIVITDATMAAQVISYLDGKDDGSASVLMVTSSNRLRACKVDSIVINEAGPDLVTINFRWQFNNNEPRATYSTYFKFALSSPAPVDGITDLALGEYGFDWVNDRVYYRPVNGNADYALIADIESPIKIDPNATVSFESVTIEGGIGPHTAAACIDTNNASVSISDSVLKNGTSATWGPVDMTRCDVRNMLIRGISAGKPGMTVSRTSFRNIESSGAIFLQGDKGLTMSKTTIDKCYFNMPNATHGQCISAYQGAWQEIEITNNIFNNSVRFMRFSTGGTIENLSASQATFSSETITLEDSVIDGFKLTGFTISCNTGGGSADVRVNGSSVITNGPIIFDSSETTEIPIGDPGDETPFLNVSTVSDGDLVELVLTKATGTDLSASLSYWNRNAHEGTTRFENNLILTDSALAETGSPSTIGGQPGFIFDGSQNNDDHLSAGHQVLFRHNTILIDNRTVFDPFIKLWSMNMAGFRISDFRFESNILAYATTADATYPHLRWANLQFGDIEDEDDETGGSTSVSMAFGANDMYSEFIEWAWDRDTLQLRSDGDAYGRTAAADGGVIGHRFSPMPTLAQMADVDWDWASTYVPQSISSKAAGDMDTVYNLLNQQTPAISYTDPDA